MTRYRFDHAAVAAMMHAGRHGDTILAHINPREAALLKAAGGSGTRNPRTGLAEFFDSDVGGGNADSPGNSNEGAGAGLGGDDHGGGGQGDNGGYAASLAAEEQSSQASLAEQNAAIDAAYSAAGFGQAKGWDNSSTAGKALGAVGAALGGPMAGALGKAAGDYATGAKAPTEQNMALSAFDIATGGLLSTGLAIGHGIQGIASALNLDTNPSPGPMGPTSPSENVAANLFSLAAVNALMHASPERGAEGHAHGGTVAPAAPSPHVGTILGGAVRGPGTGTSDSVQADVPVGSVIMPAHVVAALGGHEALDRALPGPVHAAPHAPLAMAHLSDGEHVIAPHRVAMLGRGAHHDGMRALVAMAAQGGMGERHASGGTVGRYRFDPAACEAMMRGQHMAGSGNSPAGVAAAWQARHGQHGQGQPQ